MRRGGGIIISSLCRTSNHLKTLKVLCDTGWTSPAPVTTGSAPFFQSPKKLKVFCNTGWTFPAPIGTGRARFRASGFQSPKNSRCYATQTTSRGAASPCPRAPRGRAREVDPLQNHLKLARCYATSHLLPSYHNSRSIAKSPMSEATPACRDTGITMG